MNDEYLNLKNELWSFYNIHPQLLEAHCFWFVLTFFSMKYFIVLEEVDLTGLVAERKVGNTTSISLDSLVQTHWLS